MFVSPFETSPQIFALLRELQQENQRVYLVGGAVRDAMLNRPTHDMDFVVQGGDVRLLARKMANALGGAFYMLDTERNTARVILKRVDDQLLILDFASIRAPSLEEDLRARDFTVNAMAVPVAGEQKMVDPLGGAQDMNNRVLRACSPTAFTQDPLRILRGVRLAQSLKYRIEPSAIKAMRAAVSLLPRVSSERQRDELFKLLEGKGVSAVLRVLDQLGALEYVLPECASLKGMRQSAPHVLDVWEHSLLLVNELESLWNVLVEDFHEGGADNLKLGLAVLQLGRFRSHFREHFSTPLNPNRSLRSLLFFSALYHDIGKPAAQQEGANGAIHFYEHEAIGAGVASERARALMLSQDEVQRVDLMIRNHMRIPHLARQGSMPSRRSIYRFFRAANSAGVELCLLALADELAKGGEINQERWNKKLEVCRVLLEAWWEKPVEAVRPPRLLTGEDVKHILKLKEGPQIGLVLEALQEAQAMGEVLSREEAVKFVQNQPGTGPAP